MLKSVFFGLLGACVLAGCTGTLRVSKLPAPSPPIRFLLTFDDGPSAETEDNPTAKIADTLKSNPVQAGIKAVFFVQTRWEGAGGSAIGQRLLRRLAAEGHVLGLHSGTARGHIDHPVMAPEELQRSLNDGIGDIRAVSGRRPRLLRPPDWQFNQATLAIYRRVGLSVVLTDISARDGGPVVFQAGPHLGGKIHRDLGKFRQRLRAGEMPVINGAVPLVVTFHDPNRYTAEHFAEYLSTLVQEARGVGLKLAKPPFYSSSAALARAARKRGELGVFAAEEGGGLVPPVSVGLREMPVSAANKSHRPRSQRAHRSPLMRRSRTESRKNSRKQLDGS